MEEDIKILERLVKEGELVGIYKTDEIVLTAIENLINRNKELEETLKDNWEFRDKFYIPKSKVKEILIDKIQYRQFELQQEYKDFKDDEILNTLQDIKEELLEE